MFDFRWYLEILGISGVVKAFNPEEAKLKVFNYIIDQFNDIFLRYNFGLDNISVWNFYDDDDFNASFPDVLATSY